MTAITWLCDNFLSILAVCVAFGFIIAIHELGHFIMARRVGIRCPRFALGFGPRLFAFNFHGTEFSICLLPLGGYVMMLGEDPEADEKSDEFSLVGSYVPDDLLPASRSDIVAALEKKGEEIEQGDDENAKRNIRSIIGHMRYNPDKVYATKRELEGNFNDAKLTARMAVVLGGVTMNFISALILFWIIGGCYGLVDLSPKSMPIVMKVFSASPAEQAGVKYGDEILEVDGNKVVSGSDMVQKLGNKPAVSTNVVVKRGEEKLAIDIVPNALIDNMVFHPTCLENDLPKVVEISAFGDSETTPIKAGDVITAFNGQPVTSLEDLLADFKSLSEAEMDKKPVPEKCAVSLDVQGKGTVKLDIPVPALLPVGKIGIMPAQVTEFRFLEHSINEVQSVAEGSLAAKFGFKADDVIFYVNGARVSDMDSLNKVLEVTNGNVNKDHPLIFDIARNGEHIVIKVEQDIPDAVTLGLTMRPITMSLIVKRSFSLIGNLIIAPVVIVDKMVKNMLSPELVKASMSGPLGIMQMIFELSNDGVGKLLYIIALINAAVGAFNVLPFPALDGARFCVLLFGFVRGKEVDPRKEAMVHNIGLFVLLGLVLLVTILDVQRIFAGVPLTK